RVPGGDAASHLPFRRPLTTPGRSAQINSACHSRRRSYLGVTRMLTMRPAGSAALALTLGWLAAGHADDRTPVPPAAEIAKAEATVKELIKADYANTNAADRLAL